jgi:hypothetical protein
MNRPGADPAGGIAENQTTKDRVEKQFFKPAGQKENSAQAR